VTDEGGGPTQEELDDLWVVARKAASNITSDRHLIEESAGHALLEFDRCWRQIGIQLTENKPTAARRQWVRTVAQNYARRQGKKLGRDIPMGRQGSEPPAQYDKAVDDAVADRLDRMFRADDDVKGRIQAMQLGRGGSLGSDVADRLDFEAAWSVLSEETRWLLTAKHLDGMTAKEIAQALSRRETVTAAQVAHRLTDARRAARPLLEALLVDDA